MALHEDFGGWMDRDESSECKCGKFEHHGCSYGRRCLRWRQKGKSFAVDECFWFDPIFCVSQPKKSIDSALSCLWQIMIS